MILVKSDLTVAERIANLDAQIKKNAIKLRERIKNGTIFNFKPFSEKQLKVMTWWCDTSAVKNNDGIIADGSIRAGKTLCMSLSYVIWAMTKFNGQNFIMAGKTVGAFRRNVLFWLKLMLKAEGYKIKDHRSENMVEIFKGEVVNYFYIFGGKDERSQDLVQRYNCSRSFSR